MKASFISLAIAAASALVAATPDADFPSKAAGPPILNDCKAICDAKCESEGQGSSVNGTCPPTGDPSCVCKGPDDSGSLNGGGNARRQEEAPPPEPPFGNDSPQARCDRQCIATCGGTILNVDSARCDGKGNLIGGTAKGCTCSPSNAQRSQESQQSSGNSRRQDDRCKESCAGPCGGSILDVDTADCDPATGLAKGCVCKATPKVKRSPDSHQSGGNSRRQNDDDCKQRCLSDCKTLDNIVDAQCTTVGVVTHINCSCKAPEVKRSPDSHQSSGNSRRQAAPTGDACKQECIPSCGTLENLKKTFA
ncbi:hypothetical protein LZ32DRAFT_620913 [Colletotrichum eremochloae]|nr:hypothetical protein LZ32DRAFT_620913 [Colletotrichum eremochloae]